MLYEDAETEADTINLAERLAPLLGVGDVVALHGGLGAGKTTFARGLISALLGAPTEVPSPTYTLVQTYAAPQAMIWHFDLYRLEAADEIIELGWDDAAAGLVLVEWPERAGHHLPGIRLDVTIDDSTEIRRVSLVGHGKDWQKRLDAF